MTGHCPCHSISLVDYQDNSQDQNTQIKWYSFILRMAELTKEKHHKFAGLLLFIAYTQKFKLGNPFTAVASLIEALLYSQSL
jgi:hypothetical protein